MSENEFNINIEPIITELNLQPIDNFLYSREGFPWKYTFNKDWTLFYLWDSERLPQRYEFQTKKWIIDNSHLKNLTISELNLEATTSRWLYNRTWYTWSYNFDQRGILHYSWDAKNPPQTYDYLGKRRTLEAEREQLIKEYSLQATSKGFYTNNRQWIYSFDTKWNLFYRSEKEGTQKLQNWKWNQIPFKELPQNLQNKDATIHILWLKPHSNNKNIYTRNWYKWDYSFQENLLSYKEHNYTQYYRNNKRMT